MSGYFAGTTARRTGPVRAPSALCQRISSPAIAGGDCPVIERARSEAGKAAASPRGVLDVGGTPGDADDGLGDARSEAGPTPDTTTVLSRGSTAHHPHSYT